MVLFFTAKTDRMLCRRNRWAPLPAGIIGVVGYFLAEIAIVTLSGGTMQAAVAGGLVAVLPNMVQELAGGVGQGEVEVPFVRSFLIFQPSRKDG